MAVIFKNRNIIILEMNYITTKKTKKRNFIFIKKL